MAKRMLVDATHPEQTRVVVLNGNKLDELDFEIASRKQLKGNIYLAKVIRVEPSLQAAFVEYGGNRHGFLAFSEIHPDYYRIPVADREALIREQEELEREREALEHEEEEALHAAEHPPLLEAGASAAPTYEPTEASAAVADEVGAHETVATDLVVPQGHPEDAYVPAAQPLNIEQPYITEELPVEATSGDADGETAEFTEGEDYDADYNGGDYQGGDYNGEGDEGEAHEGEAAEGESAEGANSRQGGDAGRRHRGRRGRRGRERGDRAPQESGNAEAVHAEGEGEERRRPRSLRSYKIQEVIRRRQILLVQVTKEERGTKGAALTTYLSLPGRYCVLMPNTPRGGGISRKITNPQDRKRLKELLEELDIPKGMAVILRTAGMERSKQEIKRDLEYLMRLWDNIREQTMQAVAPSLIYEEANLIKRSIRDLYASDIDEVHVEGEAGYRTAKDFMRMLMPSHAKKIQAYTDDIPLFHRFQVDAQIDAMFNPVVQLRSGGYIVINQTEALVAIDVNSGRATKERNIEETALRTNLEAAEEVARQLRLRDLAGLIVIDFIDMEDGRNNAAVEKRLKEAMKADRARIQLGRISPFGLMELSRQRLRPSLQEINFERCPHCEGTGMVRSLESAALAVLRAIEDEGIRRRSTEITVTAASAVTLYILNQKRDALTAIERRYSFRVFLSADDSLVPPDHRLERIRARTAADDAPAAAVSAERIYAETDRALEHVDEVEDEVAEEEVEETSTEAANGEGSPQDRRRRRRRRRGGQERPEGVPQVAEATEGEQPAAEAELAGGEDADGEGAETVETADAGDSDLDANGERKKRRRGKRGGRRRGRHGAEGANGEDGEDGDVAAEGAEEAGDAGEDVTAPAEAIEAAADVPVPATEPVVEAPATDADAAPAEAVAAEAPAAEAAVTEAAVAEATPVAEEAPAKPKRATRSRKKAAPAAEEAPVVTDGEATPAEAPVADAAPAESVAEEAPAKPKRATRSRKKAVPAAEEAPVVTEASVEAVVEPTPVEPTPVEPTPVEPTPAAEPVAVEPAAAETAPVAAPEAAPADETPAVHPAVELNPTVEQPKKGWWNRILK
ncbi:Rne/Rng family ribonuclease [Nitrospirillum iridis]|uniref:Ribonuclease E n=1 Tax=Nitrospirillum iridis TaxID=765888 RepID=A0A7X0AXF9_9PROT|nr:ribonuclease E/G [Nitrospirillum iridis]MBB6251843.1 ribonuclease E [Nitrospirillum iridis]